MGWQKRSSGRRYDSLSGHGLFIGKHTKKVLAYCVKSKECITCNNLLINNVDIPDHMCPKNHEGSSKSMDTEALIAIVTKAWDEHNVAIKDICADDDTTMFAHLRHSWKDMITEGLMEKDKYPKYPSGGLKIDNGKLPLQITMIPKHLADPSHRKKVLASHAYKLALDKNSQLSKVDAEKLKINFGYMFVGLRNLDPEKDKKEIIKRGKAILEHRFGNHKYCDIAWCYYLQAKVLKKRYKTPGEDK